MIETSDLLQELNDSQREAVLATDGPVLILAGAGSGKTRVITRRIAYLAGTGRALPHEIVAVTFTNKAAGEMKERVARLLGSDAGAGRIGTFHALCLRILRRDGTRVGLPAGFQVYDTADQLGVVRAVLKDLGIEESEFSPRTVLSRISHAKNGLVSTDELGKRAASPEAKTLARCYDEYQTRLRKIGAVDFDDLILETLRLFETQDDVAERYAHGCRYLLVDEYQDTNRSQYRLVQFLARRHRNICVVGDEDQSIYRFRGADIGNILAFESDYPSAKILRLERNYRSTKTILRAASAIIEKNDRRHPKRLWTDIEEGSPLHYHRARDDRDEAEAVARIVTSLAETTPSGEIAVLYRTNNQSRLIEEAFVRHGIRYRIVGALRFYERKEVKDLLSYLRLVVAPEDDLSFQRAVNTPARGIGKTTLEQISALAAGRSVSLYGAAKTAVASNLLSPRAAGAVQRFLETIDSLREGAGMIVPLITSLVEAIEFQTHLEKAYPGDHEDRLENVEALVSAAAEYDEQEPLGGLQGFLDRSSLRSDTDDVQGDPGATLLTIHSAKGLEFSAVVLTGLEENLFPHIRSSESAEDLEEERRLCYVAITRAKKRLVLTNAVLRRSFGDFIENPPSRFLEEIPQEIMVYSESSPWGGVEGNPLRSGGAAGERRSSPSGLMATGGAGGGSRGPGRSRSRGTDEGRNRKRPFPMRPPEGASFDDYDVGRIVTHPMFGSGKILHREGAGESLKLTIRFQSSGTRKILPRHTTLVVHD